MLDLLTKIFGFVKYFFGIFDFFRIFWIFQDCLDFSGFFGSFRMF